MQRLIGIQAFISISFALAAQSPQVTVLNPKIPLLLGRTDNLLHEIILQSRQGGEPLEEVRLEFRDTESIASVRLFYSGGTSVMRSKTRSQAIKIQYAELSGGQRIASHAHYSILKTWVAPVSGEVMLPVWSEFFMKEARHKWHSSA